VVLEQHGIAEIAGERAVFHHLFTLGFINH